MENLPPTKCQNGTAIDHRPKWFQMEVVV